MAKMTSVAAVKLELDTGAQLARTEVTPARRLSADAALDATPPGRPLTRLRWAGLNRVVAMLGVPLTNSSGPASACVGPAPALLAADHALAPDILGAVPRPHRFEGGIATYGWLSGNEIAAQVALGRIAIVPFAEDQVNPNSYNYRLSPGLRRLTNPIIDMRQEDAFEDLIVPPEGLLIHPGECYLGCTTEHFGSDHYAALITGRSSVGRKFVTNHVTAGLIDQGFYGRITLEILVQRPTRVYPNIVFGQIIWFTSVGEATLYAGKYAEQTRATGSRAYLDPS